MQLLTPVAGERDTTVPTPAGTTSPSATTVTQITAHLTEAELQSATTLALMSGSTEAATSAMREEQLAPGPVRRPTLLELPEYSEGVGEEPLRVDWPRMTLNISVPSMIWPVTLRMTSSGG